MFISWNILIRRGWEDTYHDRKIYKQIEIRSAMGRTSLREGE